MLKASPRSHALPSLRAMRPLAFVLGAAVLLSSVGCHYWQPEPTFPQRPAKHAEDVRVTLYDGTRFFLERATVEGDTLVGRAAQPDGTPGRRAVALSEIRKVEGRWLHPGRTGGLVFGITLLAALGFAIAAVASMGSMNFTMGY